MTGIFQVLGYEVTRFYNVNWDIPDQYPQNGSSLTDKEWRWEFLRRSAEYYEAWQNAKPIPGEEDICPYRIVENWEEDFRMRLLLDPACDYDAKI
ncbi:MAG: hypothetical protein P8X52_09360, partial [Limibacillus sp.]